MEGSPCDLAAARDTPLGANAHSVSAASSTMPRSRRLLERGRQRAELATKPLGCAFRSLGGIGYNGFGAPMT